MKENTVIEAMVHARERIDAQAPYGPSHEESERRVLRAALEEAGLTRELCRGPENPTMAWVDDFWKRLGTACDSLLDAAYPPSEGEEYSEAAYRDAMASFGSPDTPDNPWVEPSGRTIAEQEAIAMELHAASDDPVSPSFDDLPSRERGAYFKLASRIQEVVTAHRAEPEQDGSAPEGPIKAIWLHGDGRDMVVEVEFVNRPNEWVEVIREHSGHPEVVTVSHFVEAAGIARARKGR